MQQRTDYPRDAFTVQQIEDLIEKSTSLMVGGGLELIDQDLNVIETLSDDLAGGSVARSSYATLHGTATIKLTRSLSWGDAIVRPFVTLSDGVIEARWNLGAYYTSTPSTDFQEFPVTYEVQGYDLLLRLSQRVGDAYAITAGTKVLEAVEEILLGRGYTSYVIDQTQANVTLPSAKTWALDPQITWLSVVNDLLHSIGYAGIWSDWDGRLRCEPYARPIERAAEWIYTADSETTMLGTERVLEYDYFDVPNSWVVWRANDTDGPTPVEGNGLYRYTNETTGDTSVQARGGLVITRMESVDAANQSSLETIAQAMIDADMSVPTRLIVRTAINPMHWHFDRIYVNDAAMGPPRDALTTSWTINLPPDDASLMAQEWQVLV